MIPVPTAVDYIAKLLDARGGSEEYSHDEVLVFEILRALEAAYVEVVTQYSRNQRTWWYLLPAIRVVTLTGSSVVPDVLVPVGLVVHPDTPPENNRNFWERTLVVPQYEAAVTWRPHPSTLAPRVARSRYPRHRYTLTPGGIEVYTGESPVEPRVLHFWYIPQPQFSYDGGSVIDLAAPAAWRVVHRAAAILASRDRQARRTGIRDSQEVAERVRRNLVQAVTQVAELKGEV